MSELPLAGRTVIEIASFVAGPSAGMTLAQLGAEVIRIDPIGGAADVNRWPIAENGASVYWASLNRGKRSVELDLRSETGRDLVRRMLRTPGPGHGILIDNQPGQDWLRQESLSAVRPDLVHAHIEGHRGGRPAVDYTVNAEAGIPFVTGPSGLTDPVNHVLPAWDLLCGMTVVSAVLAALVRRDRTGEGSRIDVALGDVALAGVANLGWFTEAAAGVERPRNDNSIYGSYGDSFKTSDGGHVMVVALTPAQWRSLVAMTDTTDAIAALAAKTAADFEHDEAARYVHREALAGIFAPWFAARDRSSVEAELAANRVLSAPYRDLREAAARGGGPLVALDQPGIGEVISAESPMRWHELPLRNEPAVGRGDDTRAVLQALAGVGDAAYDELIRDGVVRA
ncbi:MAG TPA: CoA transferase [Mycobacteriales bacterium]|nr:CoA transferase [Mycobacteriales bacterium]